MKINYRKANYVKPHKLAIFVLFMLIVKLSKAQCPPPGNYGNITVTPNKPAYCLNDNIQLQFNKTNPNPYFGTLNWNFTGTAGSTAVSGSNNTIFTITGFLTGGVATVNGVLTIAGKRCPFSVSRTLNLTTLQADAGPDKTFTPCGGAITIGAVACGINGNPPSTQVWSPATGIVGSMTSCQTQVNNLTSNQTYVISVTDQYCTVTDQMNVTLACPSPGSIANISTNPNQTQYCQGDNITGNLSITNSCFALSGAVSWAYTGNPSISNSGVNNVNYSISGLTAGGNITASGNVLLNGGSLSCPFSVQNAINMSNLSADAGPDVFFVPCNGAVTIGTSPCEINGSPPYSPAASWSPATGIIGPLTGCQTQVDNLTSDQTYVLTVTDQFCTATDQMNVTLACPSPQAMAGISIVPNQAMYCQGANVSGNLNINNPCFFLNTSVIWNYTGSPAIVGSGAGNVNYAITGLASSGQIVASGDMKLNGGSLICPYTTKINVNMSNLTANAGGSKVYIVGGGPITIGTNPCQLNGSPPYGTPAWSPGTGIIGPTTGCQVQVSNLTSNQTYVLTVSDQYCTATAQMKVIVSTMYGELKRELDSGYLTVNGTNLYFTIDGEYNTMNLDYKIYNYQRSVMTGLSVSPATLIHGDNRYLINVSTLSQGYYVLEVVNQKNEKRVLR